MTLRVETRPPALWITIDREERRNALSPEVIRGLIDALSDAAADDEVRVVVVTGAGDMAFCAGGDIGGFRAADGVEEAAPAAVARLVDAFWWHPKPIVARVNGRALGGGFGLMMACDLAVAADDVEVGMPEIDIGLWPHVITAVVQRTVPRRVALDLMLTGRRLPAREAARWGMVNRVVPRERLDETVDDLVATLAAKSPHVLKLGKRSFTGAEGLGWSESLQHLKEMLEQNLAAEDLVEGVTAFLERRRPEWKGR